MFGPAGIAMKWLQHRKLSSDIKSKGRTQSLPVITTNYIVDKHLQGWLVSIPAFFIAKAYDIDSNVVLLQFLRQSDHTLLVGSGTSERGSYKDDDPLPQILILAMF